MTPAIPTTDIRVPDAEHPISITSANGVLRIFVADMLIAETRRALILKEKGYAPVFYVPRQDADMSQLVKTDHSTYCPYKGECSYFSIPVGGSKSEIAVWSYETPHRAVAAIAHHVAFYSSRVDSITFSGLDEGAA